MWLYIMVEIKKVVAAESKVSDVRKPLNTATRRDSKTVSKNVNRNVQ